MPSWKKCTAPPCGASCETCCPRPRPGQGADAIVGAGGVATARLRPQSGGGGEDGHPLPRHPEFLDILDQLVPAGELGLAVSGGPDSVALLLLAAAARPWQVRVATVDHGLRPDSAGEAAAVAQLCARLGVPHDVLQVRVEEGASLQAQARKARYDALGAWAAGRGLAAVATAHHADDQAETLLMRLARGSGVAGLAGIRERRTLVPGVALVRPLLNWRKAELGAIVAGAGLDIIDDPSNRDPRHDRSRARALLAEHGWFDSDRVARSAAALASAEEALAAWTEELAARHLVAAEGGIRLRGIEALVPEMQRRLLVCAFAAWPGKVPGGPEIDRALRVLAGSGTLTLRGLKLAAKGGEWRVEPAPPRRKLHP